jgi:hypothetical protein
VNLRNFFIEFGNFIKPNKFILQIDAAGLSIPPLYLLPKFQKLKDLEQSSAALDPAPLIHSYLLIFYYYP